MSDVAIVSRPAWARFIVGRGATTQSSSGAARRPVSSQLEPIVQSPPLPRLNGDDQ